MQLNEAELAKIKNNPALKKKLASESLAWFSVLYFPHYFKSVSPDFHYKIYKALEDNDIGLLEIIAFRGSAKSTIASLFYPLWCAIFNTKNFILICSDTFPQAKQIITNLIHELEHNERVRDDFGDFRDPKEDWTATNILLKNGVRISAKSRGQKVRGLRHKEFRPDLIICDDIENIELVRTKEQRDKTEEWYLSDVVPTLDATKGKLVLIGNLLHRDSLISRVKVKIQEKGIGTLMEFPLMDSAGNNVWVEEYPTDKINAIKESVGVDRGFYQREFLLKIIATDDQLVSEVKYYSALPAIHYISIGVDLAISQKQTADYSAITAIGEAEDGQYYVLQQAINRWTFNETLEQIKSIYDGLQFSYPEAAIGLNVENNAYQQAAIEEIQRRYHLPVKGIRSTKDKRAKLSMVAPYINRGQVLFGRENLEDLIIQLVGFGTERYDDAVDSFVMAMKGLVERDRPQVLVL